MTDVIAILCWQMLCQKLRQMLLPVSFVYCYVRQCSLSCAILLELSGGSASCILLFIMCTVIHNCSSSGSFSTQYLDSILRDNMTNMDTVTNLYYHEHLTL